jgi:hypothetical protein
MLSNSEDPSLIEFQIRSISWSLDYISGNDEKLVTPILLQDKNGPCPLIALVNTLLLNYELRLRNIVQSMNLEIYLDEVMEKKFNALNDLKSLLFKHEARTGTINLTLVLSQLGDLLLVYLESKGNANPASEEPNSNTFQKSRKSMSNFSSTTSLHSKSSYDVDKLLSSLPLLHTGLSVNPILTNGNFPPGELASILFKLFELKFKHGWIINQIDSEDVEWNNLDSQGDNYGNLIEVVNELQSFDKIQDYLLDDAVVTAVSGEGKSSDLKLDELQPKLEEPKSSVLGISNAVKRDDLGIEAGLRLNESLPDVSQPRPSLSPYRTNFSLSTGSQSSLSHYNSQTNLSQSPIPKPVSPSLTPTQQLHQNQTLLKKWLDLNRTQLTKIGLKKLNIELSNEEFIIFFRNNHFNTMFKRGDQEFYLLITDEFLNNPSSKIVWQSLNSVSGKDDLFFSGEFLPILDIDQDVDTRGDDYMLTKQLQEQEDVELAKEMQQRYDKREQPKQKVEESDKRSFSKQKKKDKKDKKSNCVIT